MSILSSFFFSNIIAQFAHLYNFQQGFLQDCSMLILCLVNAPFADIGVTMFIDIQSETPNILCINAKMMDGIHIVNEWHIYVSR